MLQIEIAQSEDFTSTTTIKHKQEVTTKPTKVLFTQQIC